MCRETSLDSSAYEHGSKNTTYYTKYLLRSTNRRVLESTGASLSSPKSCSLRRYKILFLDVHHLIRNRMVICRRVMIMNTWKGFVLTGDPTCSGKPGAITRCITSTFLKKLGASHESCFSHRTKGTKAGRGALDSKMGRVQCGNCSVYTQTCGGWT